MMPLLTPAAPGIRSSPSPNPGQLTTGPRRDTAPLAGVMVPAVAHTVGRLRPSVAKELGLAQHGLRLVAPEVRAFNPAPRRRAVGRSMAFVPAVRATSTPWL